MEQGKIFLSAAIFVLKQFFIAIGFTILIFLLKDYLFEYITWPLIVLPNRTGFDLLIADSIPYILVLIIWYRFYKKAFRRDRY